MSIEIFFDLYPPTPAESYVSRHNTTPLGFYRVDTNILNDKWDTDNTDLTDLH
jgi:hypothetical protein